MQINQKILAFSIVCKASTLDVCPVPEAISVPFLQNNRVRFCVFTNLSKIKS
jgi:hypothetical protein